MPTQPLLVLAAEAERDRLLASERTARGEAERAAATIERNARMQARLVDDLLDATRIQAGSLHLESSPLLLDGPVRAAIEAVRPAAEQRGIEIALACEGDPPLVVGDASRLQQIASNLLVNAVKFSDVGGRVSVALRSDRAHAEAGATN